MDKSDMQEQVSAFVDGEVDGRETTELLKLMKHDRHILDSWECYHLISDSLKKNLSSHVPVDFSERVSRALEDEPVVLAPRRITPRLSPFMKQVAGLGIAASVTAVAILGTQQYFMATGGATTVAEQRLAPTSDQFERIAIPGTGTAVMPSGQQAMPASVAGTQRPVPGNMNKYLVNHNQNASGVQGVMPYARIIGHTPEKP